MVTEAKSNVFVAAGRRGAEKRWSDPANRKVVRLDALTLQERAVVLALVEAAKKAPDPLQSDAQEEDRVAARSTPTS